ncbi:DNA-binding transcriptional LysR family regulator [Palleronia aestuarii]|uniref:DNA-binding transcriptional LysR family regulator n=1 Tax=Palleronia aestuarii TaxID=568105 RepID=A0A2W7N4A9_9RHOB|nr:LysR substrate-binding domain-containing protein [Palleronia aestuarii]PZX14930.1 DNA-binding transcriptional LysR family regulator [Palleronia aestuarii]
MKCILEFMDDPRSLARDRRSGITLRELEVLQRLIQSGTAMNAARDLGISQSAVSRRLAQLEERLGLRLFERSGGRLVATVEALSINEQLRPVFDTLERIVNQSEEDDRSHSGTLSIAAPPTIAHRFLPPFVAAFCRRNPDLQVVFDVLASDALITGIAECRYDVGLTDTQLAHDGIRAEPLISSVSVCLLPEGHPLARREVIEPGDLEGEPFITLSRRHSGRTAIDRLFERAGVSRRILIEASTNVATADFVRAGLGVALVNPFPIADEIGSGVIVRPFRPVIRYTANALLPSSHAPSSAALAFVAELRAGLDTSRYSEGD